MREASFGLSGRRESTLDEDSVQQFSVWLQHEGGVRILPDPVALHLQFLHFPLQMSCKMRTPVLTFAVLLLQHILCLSEESSPHTWGLSANLVLPVRIVRSSNSSMR